MKLYTLGLSLTENAFSAIISVFTFHKFTFLLSFKGKEKKIELISNNIFKFLFSVFHLKMFVLLVFGLFVKVGIGLRRKIFDGD